jgi:hypothetical protein
MRMKMSLSIAAVAAALQLAPAQIAGVWRGESICAPGRPACVDEHVVYYITALPGKADVVSIRADKIVDGRAVTMGTSDWTLDGMHHTLTWDLPRQSWRLAVDGDTMTGTLTLADKSVVRHMTLKRDSSARSVPLKSCQAVYRFHAWRDNDPLSP